MTDSAVFYTILRLIAVFYALALLCSGLVEMIANWVKKRAKYLLRGLRDLLEEAVPAGEHTQGSVAKTVSEGVGDHGGRAHPVRLSAAGEHHPQPAGRGAGCRTNRRSPST